MIEEKAKWKWRSIESLCANVTSGGTPSRSNPDFYKDGKIPWLKTKELKGYYIHDSEEKITDQALAKSSAKLFPAETVLMAMYGDGRTITSLGILKNEAATNQACCAMIPAPDECDPKFLLYSLSSNKERLLKLAIGGAQRNLSGKIIREFQILAPPVSTQRKIAGILSAYDDLIENNLRRIKILEQMAQSLYREWFVHFRFPGHEAARFIDSSVGRIPKGWVVQPVEAVLKRLKAGTVYKKNDVSDSGSIPVIDQSTDLVLGFHGNKPDHQATASCPIAIFGDHTCKIQLMTEPFSIGPNVIPFVAAGDLPLVYVYFLIRDLASTQEYKRHWIQLNSNEVAVATNEIAERFRTFVQPIFEQFRLLQKQNQNLRRTRDLLLPQLLQDNHQI